ncbi:TolC family protein [Alteromonas aestuariivivens]|uniref:TolC family protein n=1 Tax=Alteromonas aestuariivivens TaxID=1938339 RepID=A0A3D8MFY4_9ALTE|nr:TolC family protein [Alteromonas aestuariivivens]RDV29128.1 TolC family protein [Alteromonas aestuariivivens]
MLVNTLRSVRLGILFCGFLQAVSAHSQEALSLQHAIDIALSNDPWVKGSLLKQQALEEQVVAAGTLPDPTVSIGLMNLPMDSWSFDQEAMTQFKIGVTQMFPRGDALEIRQGQLKAESQKYPLLRDDRRATIESKVTQLWLEVYQAQATIALIEQDKALFEQLVEVTRASYASATGKTRQQDIIRAQLELVQLDDRLTVQYQQLEAAAAQLSEWLYQFDAANPDMLMNFDNVVLAEGVAERLPELTLDPLADAGLSRSELARRLAGHPAILAIDVSQQVAHKETELARQQNQPQWGVNASYAYRDSAPNGMDRADFFSVGVTFDLPLFSENRQDKQVSASVAMAESVKTEKLLTLKAMLSQVEKGLRQLARLRQRDGLYSEELLAQVREQSEASLTAYTNDDGDFAEVIRARIAELNAKIAALQIEVDILKITAQLNYYFAQSGSNPAPVMGDN